MAKLFSFFRPLRNRIAGIPLAGAARSHRPLRIYRDPSHIVMVGNIHDICLKLDQAVAERYCHIDG